MSQPKPIYSYVAAATLALVTIFTFYVFRDFGPQSAIRRFHRDAVRQNYQDLDRVIVDGSQGRATTYLSGFVLKLVKGNVTYEIRDIKRLHNQVLVTVEYRAPNGIGDYVAWHVLQGPHDWRIDSQATVQDPANPFQNDPDNPFQVARRDVF